MLPIVEQTIKDLNTWADFLEHEVPEGNFHIDKWYSGTKSLDASEMDGTVACAAGWATAISKFRRRGLKLRDGYVSFFQNTECRMYHDWAIAEFFKITYEQTARICFSSRYDRLEDTEITPTVVANRIREIIEEIKTNSPENN